MKILLNRASAQLAPFGSINPFGSISPLAETMGRGGWWKQQGLARMPHRKPPCGGASMPSVRKPSKAWLHSFQHRLIVSKHLAVRR